MNNIEILNDIQLELDRFQLKLNKAKQEYLKYPDQYQNQHFAAAKRAALDLKLELTKLTQSCKYKYNTDD